jgi:glycosyltransferase involved in cell wall biosynthesis
MGSAYRNADVVWNTSLHEGGSNAALEALAHGCALAMRDVPGNRELLSTPGGAPGLLFSEYDMDAVLAFHVGIASESDALRKIRWQRALDWLRAHHDPDDEGDDLEAAYARVL